MGSPYYQDYIYSNGTYDSYLTNGYHQPLVKYDNWHEMGGSGSTGHVTFGDNVPGFPSNLGKVNMTTNLVGYGKQEITQFPNGYFESSYTPYSGWQYLAKNEGAFSPPYNMSYMLDTVPFPQLEILELTATKLRGKIYSEQSGTQSGVFLGEIRQTLRLVKSPLKTVGKALKTLSDAKKKILKGGIKRYSKKFLEDFSSAYLEFSFGVQPLISDVDSTIQRVTEILEEKKFTSILVKEDGSEKLDTEFHTNNLNGRMTYDTQLIRTVIESARGKALIKTFPEGPSFKPSSFGFRLADFVPTLYELIPYSFIIDYFSNLNELVNAQFIERQNVIFAYVTRERVCEAQVAYGNFRDTRAGSKSFGACSNLITRKRDVIRQDEELIPDTIQVSQPDTAQISKMLALLINQTTSVR